MFVRVCMRVLCAWACKKLERPVHSARTCLIFTRACVLRQLGHLHHSPGCSVQAGCRLLRLHLRSGADLNQTFDVIIAPYLSPWSVVQTADDAQRNASCTHSYSGAELSVAHIHSGMVRLHSAQEVLLVCMWMHVCIFIVCDSACDFSKDCVHVCTLLWLIPHGWWYSVTSVWNWKMLKCVFPSCSLVCCESMPLQ